MQTSNTCQDNPPPTTATKGGLKKGGTKKNVKSFRWDEDSIALQDLERGTRMKIDEPKTPYTGPAPDPVELVDAFSLDRPSFVASTNPEDEQSKDEPSGSDSPSDPKHKLDFKSALTEAMEQAQKDETEGRSYWDDSASDAHKKAFEQKRKQHYRMFR